MQQNNGFDPEEKTPVRAVGLEPKVWRAQWFAVAKIEMAKQVREFAGDEDNPRIQEYLRCVGLPFAHDEVPWCSAFANWCMEKSGYLGTRKANARSWLDWGVELAEPKEGCVVVFSRPPDPAHGHVAFYCRETENHIEVLGGNLGNSVSRALYPKSRWLAYRGPKE